MILAGCLLFFQNAVGAAAINIQVLILFFLSLQSAVGAAAINIQVPILLGQVTNVVSKFTADNVGDFLEEIKKPAMKLMGVYALQVGIITCQCTSSVSLLFQHGACSIQCMKLMGVLMSLKLLGLISVKEVNGKLIVAVLLMSAKLVGIN